MSANPRQEILDFFKPLFAGTGGIDSWLLPETPDIVFTRLKAIEDEPLTLSQLNQLLVFCHEAPMTLGFFRYYWLTASDQHPYNVRRFGFKADWLEAHSILSLEHLRWGFTRFYTDALLYFGAIRTAYRSTRSLDEEGIVTYFRARRCDTAAMRDRGRTLPLRDIHKDNRYLISEMACKSLDEPSGRTADLDAAVLEAYERVAASQGELKVRDLLAPGTLPDRFTGKQIELAFAADEILDSVVENQEQLKGYLKKVHTAFSPSREAALENTKLYLSMIQDLDVYVATSMRSRQDFRDMAAHCEVIFGNPALAHLNIRYFDPTLSAAEGHEDKGLIECLMVKAAKALLYFAGRGESFGKDVEAAMALTQGKPVMFFCDAEERLRFYRDVHPLSRLLDFNSGAAVGAMVASDLSVVSKLLARIFTNEMEYEIEQPKPGYLRLRESLTQSVVRLQTNDALLREITWNLYYEPTSGLHGHV